MASYRLLSSLVFLFFFVGFIEAREHLVGGKPNAWKIPSSDSESLNKWAESSRFQVGDDLVWNFDASKDSILQVTKADYDTCNTKSPIAAYKDGNTKVKLDKSGPFYFISGAEGHCQKGQKLVTVVMAPRNRFVGGPSPAPSPATDFVVEGPSPAVAPSTGGSASLKGGVMMAMVVGTLVGIVMF